MPKAITFKCGPRQRGAVAIMFGLSIFVLFGFMALAIDLGRIYVLRTELQNAADASALAGAKELNQTQAGVASAVSFAIATAVQNKFGFSNPIIITIANISVGSCPDDECMVPASSVTVNASGMTFLKVEIPSGNIQNYFAGVPTTSTGTGTTFTSTFGRAVAGRFVNDVTPIGVCALQNDSKLSRPKGENLPTTELAQFGFRRGVSYNIFNLGSLGGSSTPYLLNPVDVYPNACNSTNSSATSTAPFICGGASAIVTRTPSFVYGNTGLSASKIEAALNSRFNNFTSPSVCIPAVAPPDSNIQNYGCTDNSCVTPVANWMSPTQQTITPLGIPTLTSLIPEGIDSKNEYGVLWSYSRAVRAVGVSPNAIPGQAFTPADWPTLYPARNGAPTANANFPSTVSPYLNPGHSTAPTVNAGQLNRRLLNLAIVDCPAVTGSGGCSVIPVLGVGRFFMQVPAKFGSKSKLEVEFGGLVEPLPTADIQLYR